VVGPFPTSTTGKRYVVIAIDYFTKWVEAVAMETQGSAETAAFLTGIIDRFGAPSIIRTDQGTHFQGEFAKVLAANLVDHHMSRAYHPQSNGLVECSVQTIARAVKRTVGGQGEVVAQGWAGRLSFVVRGYNMSTQASTRQSPFYLMHGWQPKVPLNTVEISRMTQDQVAEWEREHKKQPLPWTTCSTSAPLVT
jgi:transposase InsO family protein